MNQLVTVLAALCLGVSIYNVMVTEDVRNLRAEFQKRQVEVNEGSGYTQLNQRLINALANVAANTGDEAIRKMLSEQGVTYTVDQPAQAAPASTEGELAAPAPAEQEKGNE